MSFYFHARKRLTCWVSNATQWIARFSERMAALQLLGMERPFRIPFHRAQRLALHFENRTLHRVQLRILGSIMHFNLAQLTDSHAWGERGAAKVPCSRRLPQIQYPPASKYKTFIWVRLQLMNTNSSPLIGLCASWFLTSATRPG